MIPRFVFIGLMIAAASLPAHALLPDLSKPQPIGVPSLSQKYRIQKLTTNLVLDDNYRIGDDWGKHALTDTELAQAPWPVKRAVLATARVGGATGFYLGYFNGLHLMATNHHVYEDASACLGHSVSFPYLKKSFVCEKFFGSWTDVDLALFAIRVDSPEDAKALAEIAGNFKFDSVLTPGEPLLTAGFGVADNPGRKLVINEDRDCVVFSGSNDFRFMGDPDEFNPGPYKAWSFANGCDVSHGDSGSAMVDRNSGAVIGIIWTGKIPKNAIVQSSTYLQDLLAHPTEAIWTELSYAVPAKKIGEFLSQVAQDPVTPAETSQTLHALLQK